MHGSQKLVKAKLKKEEVAYKGKESFNINFREVAAIERKTCKEAYNNFVSKAVPGNSSTNLNGFSHLLKPKDMSFGVVPLLEKGTIVISNTEESRVLNNQFCSVFTKEDFKMFKLTSPFSPEMPVCHY